MSAPVETAVSVGIEGLGDLEGVSGLLIEPPGAVACFVFAHGAGAGMAHPFMAQLSYGLAERRIATLRYQFPAMERGSKRPDTPRVAHAAVRASVAETRARLPTLPLIAGGKSFGGRMTSQAQASEPLEGVVGLVFVGFPLHPAGRPSADRAEHLRDVNLPMLFLQGSRDELAELSLLRKSVASLGTIASLCLFDDADHSFHVPARSGRTDQQVIEALSDAVYEWTTALLAG